jgi:hypothetical protein
VPFTDSPVRRSLRLYLPGQAPQNESTATAESLRGIIRGSNGSASQSDAIRGRVQRRNLVTL